MGVGIENQKKTNYRCFRCGTFVLEETVEALRKEYPFYCPTCDENMYSFEVNKDDMRRDTWIVVNEMSTAIMNLNSLFCERDNANDDPQIATQDQIDIIARGIASKSAGIMSLEDAIVILQRAYEMKKES